MPPVILLSQITIPYGMCVLYASRSRKGIWLFYLQAFIDDSETLKNIRTQIKIKSANDSQQEFTFAGPPNECSLTQKQIKKSGNCLLLYDEQVARLKERNKLFKIFLHYEIPEENVKYCTDYCSHYDLDKIDETASDEVRFCNDYE